jgi:hypothetical protein
VLRSNQVCIPSQVVPTDECGKIVWLTVDRNEKSHFAAIPSSRHAMSSKEHSDSVIWRYVFLLEAMKSRENVPPRRILVEQNSHVLLGKIVTACKYLSKRFCILSGVSQWGCRLISVDSDHKRPAVRVPRLIDGLAGHL